MSTGLAKSQQNHLSLIKKIWSAAVILLLSIIYFPSMQGEFLFDDIYEIEQNPHLRNIFPLSDSMFSYHTLPVRPLPYLTFAINYAVHGTHTFGYHLVNVLLHVLTGLILYQVIYSTLKSSWSRLNSYFTDESAFYISAMTSSLWLVHPLQTQAVSYIYQRIEVMVCLMILLSIFCFQRYQSTQKYYWLWLTVVSAVLGIFCKESAFIIPLLILSYDRLIVEHSKNDTASARNYWFYPALFSVWIIQAGLISSQSQNYGEFSGTSHDRWQYLFTQSWVILHYLKLMIYPFPLMLDYHWIPVTSLSGSFPASIFLTLGVLITLFAIIKRYAWGYPLIWFYVTLAPSSSFVPVISICTEHRMYLPLAAPLLGGVLLIFYLTQKIKWRYAILMMILIGVTGYFSCITYNRNFAYQTKLGMWEDVRLKSPDNPNCYWYLGKTYSQLGQIEDAIKAYETGLTKHIIVPGNRAPLQSKFHNELGLLYARNEKTLTKAQQHYIQSFTINPNNVEAHNNLGILYFKCGYPKQAEEQFIIAIKRKPDFELAKHNLNIVQETLRGKK